MSLLYMTALMISITGMMTLDHKYRIAFFNDARRTALTLGAGLIVFCLWDFAGIGLGIFSKGSSDYSLAFELLPEFPVEEILFLLLLCYLSLLCYLLFRRRKEVR